MIEAPKCRYSQLLAFPIQVPKTTNVICAFKLNVAGSFWVWNPYPMQSTRERDGLQGLKEYGEFGPLIENFYN